MDLGSLLRLPLDPSRSAERFKHLCQTNGRISLEMQRLTGLDDLSYLRQDTVHVLLGGTMKRAARQDNERGAGSPRISFTSTEAQNNFGQVLGRAIREGPVFITRYDRPQAVVLSIEEYTALTGEAPVDLQALEREFDAMLDAMQTPEHRAAADALFSRSAEELGEAAVRGVAERG